MALHLQQLQPIAGPFPVKLPGISLAMVGGSGVSTFILFGGRVWALMQLLILCCPGACVQRKAISFRTLNHGR